MEFLKVTTVADDTFVLYPAELVRYTCAATKLISSVDLITADGSGVPVYTSISLTGKRADLVAFTKNTGFSVILSSSAAAV